MKETDLSRGQIANRNDPLVKDLVRKYKLEMDLAIDIMYQIRGNVNKYFRIEHKEK